MIHVILMSSTRPWANIDWGTIFSNYNVDVFIVKCEWNFISSYSKRGFKWDYIQSGLSVFYLENRYVVYTNLCRITNRSHIIYIFTSSPEYSHASSQCQHWLRVNVSSTLWRCRVNETPSDTSVAGEHQHPPRKPGSSVLHFFLLWISCVLHISEPSHTAISAWLRVYFHSVGKYIRWATRNCKCGLCTESFYTLWGSRVRHAKDLMAVRIESLVGCWVTIAWGGVAGRLNVGIWWSLNIYSVWVKVCEGHRTQTKLAICL